MSLQPYEEEIWDHVQLQYESQPGQKSNFEVFNQHIRVVLLSWLMEINDQHYIMSTRTLALALFILEKLFYSQPHIFSLIRNAENYIGEHLQFYCLAAVHLSSKMFETKIPYMNDWISFCGLDEDPKTNPYILKKRFKEVELMFCNMMDNRLYVVTHYDILELLLINYTNEPWFKLYSKLLCIFAHMSRKIMSLPPMLLGASIGFLLLMVFVPSYRIYGVKEQHYNKRWSDIGTTIEIGGCSMDICREFLQIKSKTPTQTYDMTIYPEFEKRKSYGYEKVTLNVLFNTFMNIILNFDIRRISNVETTK
jgi:hypothetical protein